MSTVDERLTALETEFRTELRHLVTKADLIQGLRDLEGRLEYKIARSEARMIGLLLGTLGLMMAGFGTLIGLMRAWG